MQSMKLTVILDQKLSRKLRRYVWLRLGEDEGSYGKISEVTRLALEQFLDRELPPLEKEGRNPNLVSKAVRPSR